jgi:hypothetical protein
VKPSVRVRVEGALAATAGLLCVLTIVWPDWIEGVLGFDPDHHNGVFEWLIVLVLAAISITSGFLARQHLRVQAQADSRF